jgi:transcriptional regulator with XRE-family HTH domain
MNIWRDKEARTNLRALLLKEVGARVRKIRKSDGLTQSQIANRMGVATPVVSDLERGQLNPTLNTFLILCTALDIEPDELLANLPKTLDIEARFSGNDSMDDSLN